MMYVLDGSTWAGAPQHMLVLFVATIDLLKTRSNLTLVNCVTEEIVEQKVSQVGIIVVRGLNVSQEDWANDATASPHQSDPAIVLKSTFKPHLISFQLSQP